MKRFQFLAAMFGVGAVVKGQRWSKMHGEPGRISMDETREPVYKHSHCPVCGTLALAWKPTLTASETEILNSRDPKDQGMKEFVEAMKRSRITRCKTCNAAFWQDAEK